MQRVTVEVGLLTATRRYPPVVPNSPRSLYGVTARRASRKASKETTKEVFQSMSSRYDFLLKPFWMSSNKDVMNMARDFWRYFFGRSAPKRLENLAQAIIRNPILKRKYGSNAQKTIETKGFDHVMIDTGQMFKSITARLRKV
jgi:hypothetical protein